MSVLTTNCCFILVILSLVFLLFLNKLLHYLDVHTVGYEGEDGLYHEGKDPREKKK